MTADSDSSIAWHRAQLKKHRETLKDLETSRFTIGEIAGSKKSGQTQKTIADLRRKITLSEHIIAAHERQNRRPRATDHQSLANARWSSWDANGSRPR
jgi:hypothetical protein